MSKSLAERITSARNSKTVRISTCNHITDPDLHEIAAAQLAIDGEVKKGSVPQSSLAIGMKSDRPDLLLG